MENNTPLKELLNALKKSAKISGNPEYQSGLNFAISCAETQLEKENIYFQSLQKEVEDLRNKLKIQESEINGHLDSMGELINEKEDKQEFEVRKYIKDLYGEISVWCNEWYGRHVIGQDCEFKANYQKSLPDPSLEEIKERFFRWVYDAFGSPRFTGPEERKIWEFFAPFIKGGVDDIEHYKLIMRLAGVPQVIIENPGFFKKAPLNQDDLDWAEQKIKEHKELIATKTSKTTQ